MAQGSHMTSWKQLGLNRRERICADCGNGPLRIQDVARLHWEGGKLSIRCVECMARV
jgi:hypothetical protein